ncbi:MAG: C40 family peptidase [Leptospiraceae bacterium]|nr:C40 family peptidase [Leptospiraceae bacterium]
MKRILLTLFFFSGSISLFSVNKDEHSTIRNILYERHGLLVQKNDGDNWELFKQVVQWEGVPYRMGEKSKDGMGTTELISEILDKAYAKTISGTPSSLFRKVKIKKKWEIPEQGDLLFFRFGEDNISHVAVFLKDKLFIHSTVKKGVSVDSLDDPFFSENLYAIGKIPDCED